MEPAGRWMEAAGWRMGAARCGQWRRRLRGRRGRGTEERRDGARGHGAEARDDRDCADVAPGHRRSDFIAGGECLDVRRKRRQRRVEPAWIIRLCFADRREHSGCTRRSDHFCRGPHHGHSVGPVDRRGEHIGCEARHDLVPERGHTGCPRGDGGRPREATERGLDGHIGKAAVANSLRDRQRGPGDAGDTIVRRRGDGEQCAAVERRKPLVHTQRGGSCELRQPQDAVRRQNVAELTPGASDQVLLARLHDLRPQARCNSRAHVEVELADPRRGGSGPELDDERVLVAVDRRRHDGIRDAVADELGRLVEQDGEARAERLLGAGIAVRELVRVERPQRAVEPDDRARVVDVCRRWQRRLARSRSRDVERARSDARR